MSHDPAGGAHVAWPIHWFDEIDSTNEEARRRARAGDLGPLWIAAREQSAGRGRLGRGWVSPQGNLFSTALFAEPNGLEHAVRVPFASGLAVADACRELVPQGDFRLKWPNDVRVEGAKLCGILVESGSLHGTTWIAAGIGINVKSIPGGAGQAATSLADLGAHPGIAAEDVLNTLCRTFSKRLAQARTDFQALLRDWLGVAEGHGQTVTAGPPEARLEGIFEGLADDGGLILRLPNGQTQIIRAGDVELVRQVG